MTFLVDANILSEGMRETPEPKVVRWLQAHEENVVIDPIILGELRFGVLRLPAGRKRRGLERWFAEGIRHIVCLPWDGSTALRWADLLAQLRRSGREMPIKDSMIAATALCHGLVLVTHNRRDFEKSGVRMLDPFD